MHTPQACRYKRACGTIIYTLNITAGQAKKAEADTFDRIGLLLSVLTGCERLLYVYLNISCVGRNFAASSCQRFRNRDTACIALRQKNLIRKQASSNITRFGFNKNFFCIASVKRNIPRASFNGELT
jgi:hypothetical protein